MNDQQKKLYIVSKDRAISNTGATYTNLYNYAYALNPICASEIMEAVLERINSKTDYVKAFDLTTKIAGLLTEAMEGGQIRPFKELDVSNTFVFLTSPETIWKVVEILRWERLLVAEDEHFRRKKFNIDNYGDSKVIVIKDISKIPMSAGLNRNIVKYARPMEFGIAYWFDGSGKQYKVENEHSHWVADNKKLLQDEYSITGDVSYASLIRDYGWNAVGVVGSEVFITCGDWSKSLPYPLVDYVLGQHPDTVIIDDFSGRVSEETELTNEEFMEKYGSATMNKTAKLNDYAVWISPEGVEYGVAHHYEMYEANPEVFTPQARQKIDKLIQTNGSYERIIGDAVSQDLLNQGWVRIANWMGGDYGKETGIQALHMDSLLRLEDVILPYCWGKDYITIATDNKYGSTSWKEMTKNDMGLMDVMTQYAHLITAEQDFVYAGIDGDDIGDAVENAVTSEGGVEEAMKISAQIASAQAEISKIATESGGQVIFSGGDNSLVYVPNKPEIFEAFRRAYKDNTEHTATVGVGSKPIEAHKSLVIGKQTGKDKVVVWHKELEPMFQKVVDMLVAIDKKVKEISQGIKLEDTDELDSGTDDTDTLEDNKVDLAARRYTKQVKADKQGGNARRYDWLTWWDFNKTKQFTQMRDIDNTPQKKDTEPEMFNSFGDSDKTIDTVL